MGDLIERVAPGRYAVRISRRERDVLRGLPGELRSLLGTEDLSLRRLFPSAYPDDPEAERSYREMTRTDLQEGRLAALAVLETTVGKDELDEPQLTAWVGALNDLRLVLGTRLAVTEDTFDEPLDERDPRAPALALYGYLGWLQEQAIAALAAELPG